MFQLCDVLQLAAVMWLMTYIGAVFNGVTILILGECLPYLYLTFKCLNIIYSLQS